jgi:hypothetical protein
MVNMKKVFQLINSELESLPGKKADARLIRFRILDETYGVRVDFIEEILSPARFNPKSNPVIFVHGVDYADDREAVTDFILPLVEATGLGKSRRSSEFYLLTWNSMLFSRATRDRISVKPLKRLKFYLAASLWWSRFWRDAERRADEAAESLAGFIDVCFARGLAPSGITHSAGGIVWAGAMKRIMATHADVASGDTSPGLWWNLQPAIPDEAFCAEGDYAAVAALYEKSSHGRNVRHVVWFSRMDFILGALYRFARKAPAMGQWGSRSRAVRQRDVTWMTMEAHGNNVLMRLPGNFFARARRALRVDARILGLV